MLGVFLLIFILVGCLPIPKEHHPYSITPSPSLEKSIEKGIADNVLTESPTLYKWWEIFADSNLSYLIEKALLNNPSLQEAAAKIETARNEAKIRRSSLFPTIWLNGEVNAQHLAKNGFFRAYAPAIPADVVEYTVGLDFSYELDFWGKRKNLYYASLGKTRAQEAEKAQADLIISSEVAVVYFKIQGMLQQLDIINKQQEIASSLINMRKRRQKHALDSINQVLEAENSLLMIQHQALNLKQNLDLIKHQLSILIGEGPEEEENVSRISLKTLIKVPVPAFLPFDLLAYRPDLMAQIWRVEAAAHEVGAAKADFYPNINLNALVGLDTVFIEKLFSTESISASVVPAFHLPIFTAGRIKANLEVKRAVLEQEIQVYNQLLLEAAKDVADQIVSLRIANENLHLQLATIENRLKFQHVIYLQLKNAIATSLESLEANLEVLNQEWIKVDMQYQYYLAVVKLMRALGGGYISTCIPILCK